MARAPSGPLGNSPRDTRDDAVGVPADELKAPMPPRWPPKRKKITSNTFHAKVSGGASSARADRKPHFRRGGMVSGFASGGSVTKKLEKHDELPGEEKNDPLAAKNLKKASGGTVAKRQHGGTTWEEGRKVAEGGLKEYKRQDGGVAGPTDESRKEGISKLSSTMKKEVSFRPGEAKAYDNPRTQSANISRYVRPELKEERGGYADGGKVGKVMHEFKHGTLHSGSKTGPTVKSREQAIAIGLSEARKAGESVPRKK